MPKFIDLYRKSGIYQIKNIINNKIYIGSSVNIGRRLKDHIWFLSANQHSNAKLQAAWNKYKEASFSMSAIEFCDKDDLLIREQYYIDTLLPKYNIKPRAGTNIGYKVSEKTKKMKSRISKRMWKNPVTRGKIMAAILSPEERKRRSESTLSVWTRPEYRKQHSLSLYGKGNSRLSADDVREIRKLYAGGLSAIKIQEKFGLSKKAGSVYRILHGITYTWVKDDE
jgi:group I intron endonuclease